MKYLKTLLPSLAFLLSLNAHGQSTMLGVGIIPGFLSWPGIDDHVVGLRTSLPIGVHQNVYGIDVGAFNITRGYLGGMQVGVLNYTGKRATVLAAQVGLANWNRLGLDGLGVQVGLLNNNGGTGRFFGLQSALVHLGRRSRSYGMVAGLYSSVGFVGGFQVGFYNYARRVHGIQIGVINKAHYLRGIQIGLVNFYMNRGRILPILNIGF